MGWALEALCEVLSWRKANLWLHLSNSMSDLDFPWCLTPTKPLLPQGLYMCYSFSFLSPHKSPHFTYLLILNMYDPSLSSSNTQTLCLNININPRSLISARLSVLPKTTLSLSTQFLSFWNYKFKPSPVSSGLWLYHLLIVSAIYLTYCIMRI